MSEEEIDVSVDIFDVINEINELNDIYITGALMRDAIVVMYKDNISPLPNKTEPGYIIITRHGLVVRIYTERLEDRVEVDCLCQQGSRLPLLARII